MTKATESAAGKRINVFEDSELTKNFIRDNISGIVDGLSKQFPEPEDSYREFVQNSIDADSPQIEVRHSAEEIDDDVSRFVVTFEDFGKGMSIIERENFFLKLFKSSKEDNPIKIGKYGIGISSAFALNLEQFIADSSGYNEETKKRDSWRLHIRDINSDPSYYFQDMEERRGTKITLIRIIRNSEIEQAQKKVHERVSYYCERVKIPLYVNDKLINVPFDIDTSIKVSSSFDGFEYVIGITDHDNAKYELFNNRLKLEEGKSSELFNDETLKNMSLLISSNRFRHTFSRESVVRDSYFMNVIKTLGQQKSNLFLKCLEIIQDYDKQIKEVKRPAPPAITIKTIYGSYRIFTRYDITSLERRLNTDEQRMGQNFRPIITNDPDEIKNIRLILKDAEKECLEYQRDLDSWRKELEIKNNQLSEAWHYICDYLEKTKNNAHNREYQFRQRNRIRKILSRNKDSFVILKKLLPPETSQYRIIDTLTHGKISISEIIDAFCKNNRLLYLQSKNESMIELIAKGGDIAVFDAGYNVYGKKEQENFQDEIINHLFHGGKYENNTYINAYRIYSTTLKTKSYEANDEQADKFIKSVQEKLPRNIKIGLNEIYYTKVDMVYEDKPIFMRSRYGSTEKTSKVSLGKKFLRFAIHDIGDTYGFDIALVLDNNQIEKLISLYSSEDENLRELSMRTIGNMITRQYAEFFNFDYRYYVKTKW